MGVERAAPGADTEEPVPVEADPSTRNVVSVTSDMEKHGLIPLSSSAYAFARIHVMLQAYMYTFLFQTYVLTVYASILQLFSGLGRS
jgi:glutamate/tyrosine decarboxylase-like PLP-dependent enzyme